MVDLYRDNFIAIQWWSDMDALLCWSEYIDYEFCDEVCERVKKGQDCMQDCAADNIRTIDRVLVKLTTRPMGHSVIFYGIVPRVGIFCHRNRPDNRIVGFWFGLAVGFWFGLAVSFDFGYDGNNSHHRPLSSSSIFHSPFSLPSLFLPNVSNCHRRWGKKTWMTKAYNDVKVDWR